MSLTPPSKAAALTCWGVTLVGCAATLIIGYNVLAASAFAGLFSLFQRTGAKATQLDNTDLLWPLVPVVIAIGVNVWVLWGRKAYRPGVSPWWVVPALAIALATFAFGVWVCADVWHTDATATGRK